jgi:hypothetical protein
MYFKIIMNGVDFFNWPNPSSRTLAWCRLSI